MGGRTIEAVTEEAATRTIPGLCAARYMLSVLMSGRFTRPLTSRLVEFVLSRASPVGRSLPVWYWKLNGWYWPKVQPFLCNHEFQKRYWRVGALGRYGKYPTDPDNPVYMREFFGPLAEEVRERRPNRLLDLGCGTGVTSSYLASLGPLQVIGLDFSSSALSLGNGGRLIQGDAGSLPFADGTFQMAVVRGLFTYLDAAEVVVALGETKRVAATLVLGEAIGYNGLRLDVSKLQHTVERDKTGCRTFVHPYVKLVGRLSGNIERLEHSSASVFMVIGWT